MFDLTVSYFAGPTVGGAAAGFISGFDTVLLNGGSLSQAMKSGAIGAAVGAAVGALTGGLGGQNGPTLQANPNVLLAANTDDLGDLVQSGVFKVVGSSGPSLATVVSSSIAATGASAAAIYGWNEATSKYDTGAPALRLPKFTVGQNPIDRSLWRVGWQAAVQGAFAFADGINPLGNPLASAGYYDPNDSALKWSRRIGVLTFTVESTLVGGAGAFFAPGESVFFSGQGARLAAMNYAEMTGGSTILDTFGGQILNDFGVQSKWIWSRASWFYANTTGKTATVFIGRFGGQAGSVFADTELPNLLARGVDVFSLPF